MSVPAFLTGAVLIFWAWQAGQPLVGVLLALLVEASRVTSARWDLRAREFNRVTDFSTLALVAALIWLVAEVRSLVALKALLIWMPVFFMPLLLAQRYSVRGRVPLTSLFLSLRSLQGRSGGPAYADVDLEPVFFGLCLVCAGAAAGHPRWFLPGVVLLFAWLLWPQRSPRFHPALWGALFAAAVGLGVAGNQGVHAVRHEMQHLFLEWYREHRRSFADPYRSYTAIGRLGELKLSDRILFRVRDAEEVPLLLRDAAYNTYSRGIWYAEEAEFELVAPGPDDTTWPLAEFPENTPIRSLEVSAELNRRAEGLITHPKGTFRVEELPVLDFWRNGLGAMKVKDGPPLITYRLRYAPALSLSDPPGHLDRLVPPELNPVLQEVADRLDLAGLAPREVVRRIEGFFADGFTYSLIQQRPDPDVQPLQQFLRETRSGHCEYFASATVLLLRKAGIPARYATGFSVEEYSALEDAFLVRRRHGHSWALAFLDGQWRAVDTTPSVWAEREAEQAGSALQPVKDLYSWLRHRFLRWRWRPEDESAETNTPWYAWLLIPLVAVLLWRLLRGKRRRGGAGGRPEAPAEFPGRDSPFYAVVERIEAAGWPRRDGEPLRPWLVRVTSSPDFPGQAEELAELLALHNRYRYGPTDDPGGLRRSLQDGVGAWLEASAPGRAAPDQSGGGGR